MLDNTSKLLFSIIVYADIKKLPSREVVDVRNLQPPLMGVSNHIAPRKLQLNQWELTLTLTLTLTLSRTVHLLCFPGSILLVKFTVSLTYFIHDTLHREDRFGQEQKYPDQKQYDRYDKRNQSSAIIHRL